MKKRIGVACAGVILFAAVLSVLRILAMPQIAQGNTRGIQNILLALFTVAAMVFLLICGGGKQPARCIRGRAFTVVTTGVLFTGVAMIVSAVTVVMDWVQKGLLPYPANSIAGDTDEVFLYLLAAFGAIGGAVLILMGIRWFSRGRTLRGILRVASLAPVVWMWIRIGRYEISYMSSLNVYLHFYDLLLLLFEMVFFLWFARYVSGAAEDLPRFSTGISLCTGVLATVACVTRVAMLIAGNKEAFDLCGLVTAPDLGVAVLALSFAFGHWTAPETDDYEEVPEDGDDEEDGEDGSPFLLLTEEAFMTSVADDEELDAQGLGRPLELEDVINDVMGRMGEK